MESRQRKAWRPVDGVLLLDKPSGVSSNTALQRARRLFSAAKAGHTGTLDPLASGLLPLCFGEATKFSQTLLDADKAYDAVLRLGVRTDTGDAEGQVLETRPVAVTEEALAQVLGRFRGGIEQVPPMHSALKHQGRPLYDYARAGVEIERASRRVTVHRLELLGREGDLVRIAVDCSKGTYIRTLAEDIGAALGCGAHLASLRRTRIGTLSVADSCGFDALEALDGPARDRLLAPADALLCALPSVLLGAADTERLVHGQRVPQPAALPAGRVRAYGPAGFLGLAEAVGEWLQPVRLLASPGGKTA